MVADGVVADAVVRDAAVAGVVRARAMAESGSSVAPCAYRRSRVAESSRACKSALSRSCVDSPVIATTCSAAGTSTQLALREIQCLLMPRRDAPACRPFLQSVKPRRRSPSSNGRDGCRRRIQQGAALRLARWSAGSLKFRIVKQWFCVLRSGCLRFAVEKKGVVREFRPAVSEVR